MKKFLLSLSFILVAISAVLLFGCKTEYSLGGLSVNYVIDSEVFYSAQVNFNDKINQPEIKDRDGYVFKGWYLMENYVIKWNFDSDTVKDDLTLYGYWCTEAEEQFNVLFYDGDKLIHNEKVLKETVITEYEIQPREGYELKGWTNGKQLYDFSSPVCDDLNLSAVWELIVYTVNFKADGKIVSTAEYTVENRQVTLPDVPVKEFYNGEWENFVLTAGDINVNADYAPIVYSATYYINDVEIEKIRFTAEDEIHIPVLPVKKGYTGKWSDTPALGKEINIYAEYRPIEYTVNFVAPKGTTTINCTVEDKINLPDVPEIAGYQGAWETIEFGDSIIINVSANYSLINYTATFIADDNIIKVAYFNVENLQITEPTVPPKQGYIGTWASYTLSLQDIIITAEYLPER